LKQAATTPELESATRLRQVIARLSRRLRPTEAGAEAGLTPARAAALLNVDRNGPMRLSDLAAAELLNPTMLSRMLGDLVADGLLERVSDPNDRRSAWVSVTTAGAGLARRMRRERTEAVTAALAALSPEEATTIETALPAIERLADELLGGGR
jgi:DNA-binding MarR family transcriptional regulator